MKSVTAPHNVHYSSYKRQLVDSKNYVQLECSRIVCSCMLLALKKKKKIHVGEPCMPFVNPLPCQWDLFDHVLVFVVFTRILIATSARQKPFYQLEKLEIFFFFYDKRVPLRSIK